MSWFQHNAWPVEAIGLLRQAKEKKKLIDESVDTAAAEHPEVKSLERRLASLRRQKERTHDALDQLYLEIEEKQRRKLARIREEIEQLNEKAKAIKRTVPSQINDFIAALCEGTSYSAGFQIVWWNQHYVILRLAGRQYFGGIGRRNYARSEHRMYDLGKWGAVRKNHNFTGSTLENHCKVKEQEGRLAAKVLADWKEEAEYRAK